jgi:sulfite reductase (NADPH) hemoprotein beta-component
MSQKQPGRPSEIEKIKSDSAYLRGDLEMELVDPITGGVSQSAKELTKFHGIYLQDDRDSRERRRKKKLEPAFSFMVRIRIPGGACTPKQWLQLDDLARRYAGGSLRLTTRQSVQFHGILRNDLKTLIRDVCAVDVDTLAACGDVNRNVMCTVDQGGSEIQQELFRKAVELSRHLTPRTTAYREIWLAGEKVHESGGSGERDVEPIYGNTYLPRKFKVAFALPPANDVDVFAHDLGFIAIEEEKTLVGYNITVGGGMGMSHGEPQTYPQLGRVIGFCTPEEVVDVAEKVVMIQRDYGDRSNRKHARLKYTIDDRGVPWFVNELAERRQSRLDGPRPYLFHHSGDRYGWFKAGDGSWKYTVFIENGRVRDDEGRPLMSGLRELAQIHKKGFRLTPNQNLMVANVHGRSKRKIENLLQTYDLTPSTVSILRRNAMACVALPSCGLAMAEAERYLPGLLTQIEAIMDELGISKQEVTVRMTGCPNGCARPYLGEIGLVGKAPGKYNLYVGAGFSGERLSVLYRENVDEAAILAALRDLLGRYAMEREDGEHFGDFLVRQDIVAEVTDGRQFHTAVAVTEKN